MTSDSLGPEVVDNICIKIRRAMRREYAHLVRGLWHRQVLKLQEYKGVVSQIKPDVCIAIDALAARSVNRLNSTIQLSDQGINPGSGVGNHRIGITKDNIGVPVLAIGVPTVIDAEGIIQGAGKMYVTPKDIDSDIRNISIIISKAINRVGVHIHG
ncbi:MAG: GPR endopeptidase [Lachnospira eligens]